MDTIEAKLKNSEPEEEINWSLVENIVVGYIKRRPEEVRGCIRYVQELKKNLKDTSFATASAESQTRHLYEIPSGMSQALLLKFPKVLKGKNVNIFLKKFPFFQIPEKL